jgi:hypothetical protein
LANGVIAADTMTCTLMHDVFSPVADLERFKPTHSIEWASLIARARAAFDMGSDRFVFRVEVLEDADRAILTVKIPREGSTKQLALHYILSFNGEGKLVRIEEMRVS